MTPIILRNFVERSGLPSHGTCACSDSDAAVLKSYRSARRTYVRIDRPISRRAIRTPKFSRRDKAAYTNKQLAVRRKKISQDSETQDRHPH